MGIIKNVFGKPLIGPWCPEEFARGGHFWLMGIYVKSDRIAFTVLRLCYPVMLRTELSCASVRIA